MANGARTALGLSIGATNLAAITGDSNVQAITRKPVVTLYRNRSPEVGIPSENPRLDQTGLVITGFVNRIGDPRPVVANDGSVHRSEALIADGLRALAYAVSGGRALPENVAVTYPAHWASHAVDALGAAVSEVPEWSNPTRPLLLIPDAAATLLAVRTNAGLPPQGTVAVCDFGGSGTNVTLMAAAGDYRALVPTVRYREFSGDLIDQALLSAVVANMGSPGSFDASETAAIGSLSRLRAGCRSAKEELSTSTVTTLTDGLTRSGIRLTRAELDEAIAPPLHNFLTSLEDMLARNGIQDLAAVILAGGGANVPVVATTLSRRLRVPVVTTLRPQLTAAVGGALRAARDPSETGATASAPAAATAAARAPLWPVPNPAPRTAAQPVVRDPRPEATATAQAAPAPAEETGGVRPKRKGPFSRWYRLGAVAIIGTTALLVLLLVATAVAVELGKPNKSATTPPPRVSSSPATSPAKPAPPPNSATAQPAPPSEEAPVPSTSDTTPPADTETPTTSAPRAVPQAAPPAAPARPAIPRAPAIPQIPQIPILNEPIPGLDRVNQIIQGINGDLGLVAQAPRP
jgi:actin-like ATPase involved in cell morphogenesis